MDATSVDRQVAGWVMRYCITTAVLITAGAPAFGEDLTVTPAVASDYDFRGITQTAGHAAVQLSADYFHEPLHLQIWASNVNFDESSAIYGARHTEVSYTAEVALRREGLLHSDIGFNYYSYPGHKPNADFGEAFWTTTLSWLGASLHYAWNYDDTLPRRPAYYMEVNATPSLKHTTLQLLAHIGESWGPYWTALNQGSYLDYWVGIGSSPANYSVTIRLVDTVHYRESRGEEPFMGKRRIILYLSATFPREMS